MTVLVIDGQGGNLGRQIVRMIADRFPLLTLRAVGTNSTATENMLRGGVENAATGENAVIVGCRHADIIIGPIGIVIADALMGEVTPAMATAVGQSDAVRILIPMNRCATVIAGVAAVPTAALLEDAMNRIGEIVGEAV